MSQILTSQYEIEIKQLQEELKETNEENKTELEKIEVNSEWKNNDTKSKL